MDIAETSGNAQAILACIYHGRTLRYGYYSVMESSTVPPVHLLGPYATGRGQTLPLALAYVVQIWLARVFLFGLLVVLTVRI